MPRALHRQGKLAALYTDFWAGPLVRRLAINKLRPLGTRCHPELADPDAKVCSWNFRSLGWEYLQRQKYNGSSAKYSGRSPFDGFVEIGRRFAVCVRNHLNHSVDPNSETIFFAYDTGALEAMEWCRGRNIPCVLNQMDPGRVEMESVQAEEKRWPGWAARPLVVPEEYFARREAEWALADRIVVNSRWSLDALVEQGVPEDKLVVVPLCYESTQPGKSLEVKHRRGDEPLHVLFLGQVILRKGIQYLMEAARQLLGERIRFDVVGPVGISNEALAKAPSNVTFHGRAGRDQAAFWYQRAHVFVLPTLSDGFAITQLEAMAHGLPVVATPCCGEVIDHGVDGFIVPARDAGALARALQRYFAQPEQLPSHSAAALKKAGQFTLARLAAGLTRVESDLK